LAREPAQCAAHVTAHHACERVELERAQIATQCGETRVAALDEHRALGPPGKRFDTERARASVQIEHAYTVEIGEPCEQRLAHAICRRSHARRRCDEAPTTQSTAGDAHLDSLFRGGPRFARLRLAARRPTPSASLPHVVAHFHVARHAPIATIRAPHSLSGTTVEE